MGVNDGGQKWDMKRWSAIGGKVSPPSARASLLAGIPLSAGEVGFSFALPSPFTPHPTSISTMPRSSRPPNSQDDYVAWTVSTPASAMNSAYPHILPGRSVRECLRLQTQRVLR